MNLVLNVNLTKKLENNDILIYAEGVWINLSKDEFLGKLNKEVNLLKEENKNLKDDLNYALKAIKELRGED